jgi:predicted DNA-binding transcriptional regulator YafY
MPQRSLESLCPLELTMEVGGAADVRTWVLSFGAGAEVIEPASLREDVARELTKAAARYL